MIRKLNLSQKFSKPTYIKQTPSPKVLKTYKLDWLFLGLAVLLTLFGLLMVYDVSQVEAFKELGDKYYYFKQQTIWVTIGFIALGLFSFIDYHLLQKIALPFLLFALLLLVLVFIPGLGVNAGGAHRWLKLMGFTIQPSEIIKLATVIYLAHIFESSVKTKPFLIIVALVGVIIGLLQKDLGSAIVFTITTFSVYFLAGAPLLHVGSFLGLSAIGMVVFTAFSAYRRQRMMAFLDPFADPQGYTYHISQVLIALGSGGLTGVGVGQSRQKFAYIPEVTTDSIFSIIGEEFGFVGSTVLIIVIGYLILRGFRIAQQAPDKFGRLLGYGLISWLGIQAAINLGAMVSIIPLTGVPLPFISYGGSALLSNLVAVGILLNISKQKVG